jgi:hypothetical protein
VHRIVLDGFGTQPDTSSKLTTDYDFFEMLRTHSKTGGTAFSRRALRRYRAEEHRRDDLRTEAQAEWA